MTTIDRRKADRIPALYIARIACPECGSHHVRGYVTRGNTRYFRCRACKGPFKVVQVDGKLPESGIDLVAGPATVE